MDIKMCIQTPKHRITDVSISHEHKEIMTHGVHRQNICQWRLHNNDDIIRSPQ